MRLLESILTMALVGSVMLLLHTYEARAYQQRAISLLTKETAAEQFQFSRAVGEYLETVNLTEGAEVSVSTLVEAGLLPTGFPSVNPFGQVPMAYIGNNKIALATYVGLPSPTILAALGYNVGSAISMSGLVASVILEASADQGASAYMLVAVQNESGIASSPFDGRTVTLANYFTGFPTPSVPVFGELVNMDTIYSGGVNE